MKWGTTTEGPVSVSSCVWAADRRRALWAEPGGPWSLCWVPRPLDPVEWNSQLWSESMELSINGVKLPVLTTEPLVWTVKELWVSGPWWIWTGGITTATGSATDFLPTRSRPLLTKYELDIINAFFLVYCGGYTFFFFQGKLIILIQFVNDHKMTSLFLIY